MNPETKESVSRALELLRGHLSAIDTNHASTAPARAVAVQLEDRRRHDFEATGRGGQELADLMAEIARNNAHITKLGEQLQELCLALNKDLWPIYPQANTVLNELYDQQLAAAVQRVRPLVGTDREADKEAENTIECRAIRRAITTLGAGPWDRAESHARIIVQYFEAALQAA